MRRLRLLVVVLSVASSMALFSVVPASPAEACGDGSCPPPSPCVGVVLENPRNENRVSLCHFTGGTTIVTNEVSLSALETHSSHHGDCYRKFNEDTVCIP
jgi:hypothetical protein